MANNVNPNDEYRVKLGNLHAIRGTRVIFPPLARMFSNLSSYFHFTLTREQLYFYLSLQWNSVLGPEGL